MEIKRKRLIILVAIVMVIVVIGIIVYYWYNGTHYVSTDNASVASDTSNAITLMSARLTELDVKIGDTVQKNDIIARQDMTGQNSLGVEASVVRAPISGDVIQTSGTVGEIVPAGTPVAIIADPAKMYITANIAETSLQKIKTGQTVDVTIDQFAGLRFEGKIAEIGQATSSFFSILPQQTSGTFTKVVQTIPVKITIEKGDYKLVPGANASVRIHIK